MIEQLVFHAQLTIHTTNKQDLNTRPCADTVHPPVLDHELMVIEPGGNLVGPDTNLETDTFSQSHHVSITR